MAKQTVVVIDFGGQYNQLIARRVREHNVYCEVLACTRTIEEIKEKNPIGIIFTGGPNSVYAEGAPKCPEEIFRLGIPVLGICYGAQLMSYTLGGKVQSAETREYGKTEIQMSESPLFEGIESKSVCWMSHTDYVSVVPEGFKIIATTDACPVAAYANDDAKLYGVQFHPEVNHTVFGEKMLANFLFNICHASGDWHMGSYASEFIASAKEKYAGKKVLCALSGGVDSSVAAVLLSRAVGKHVYFLTMVCSAKMRATRLKKYSPNNLTLILSALIAERASSASLQV